MRALTLALVSLSSAAFAQYENGGVWTGYVGGWKPNPQPVFTGGGLLPHRPAVTTWSNQVSNWQLWQLAQVQAQSQWAIQAELQRQTAAQQAAAQQQAEAARASELEQARQAQLEAERRLAAERAAMLQQQLETERRLAADKELFAMQRLEAERAAAAAAKANAEKAAQPPPVVASRDDDKPSTPGNDIYRWVDDEGVVHYSTRVPDSAKSVARRVGSR
jgi:pyruvate/2-oxoglutarate dehydrogenase complex dihydrolipoamide acyltransferase (E2) component